MNLVEAVSSPQQQSNQNQPELVGTMDTTGLAKMLDRVSDPATFQAGVIALQSGNQLSLQQRQQMALAFISMLDATPQQRQQVVVKMQGIAPQPQQTTQAQTGNAQAQQTGADLSGGTT